MEMRKLNIDVPQSLGTYFTQAYSICYIVAPLFGLYSPVVGYIPSAIVLVSVGLGLWFGVKYEIRSVLWILAIGEAMACVGHFLHLIPWSPAFSDTAYINMAMLDLIQSMFLFKYLNNQ
jgi:hypothetical protein